MISEDNPVEGQGTPARGNRLQRLSPVFHRPRAGLGDSEIRARGFPGENYLVKVSVRRWAETTGFVYKNRGFQTYSGSWFQQESVQAPAR